MLRSLTKRASLCQFANIQASQSVFPCSLLSTWKCVPLVDLFNVLLWAGQNGLPPTPNTLHFGCSYHLHSSHHFLSTWRAIMLKKDYAIWCTWCHCLGLHQVPMVTCILLRYTTDTTNLSLPSERPQCRAMFLVRHIWKDLNSEIISL